MIKLHPTEYLVLAILAIMTAGYYLDDGLAAAMILGGFWSLLALLVCAAYRDYKP